MNIDIGQTITLLNNDKSFDVWITKKYTGSDRMELTCHITDESRELINTKGFFHSTDIIKVDTGEDIIECSFSVGKVSCHIGVTRDTMTIDCNLYEIHSKTN